jgi:hypothetical protein
MLHLDELSYGGDGPGVAAGAEASDAKAATGPTLHKTVRFAGLTADLQLLPAAPDAAEAAADTAAVPAAADATATAWQGDLVLQPGAGGRPAPDSGWSMRVSTASLAEPAAGCSTPTAAPASGAGDSAGGRDASAGDASSEAGSSSSSSQSPASEQPSGGSATAIIAGEGGGGLSGHLEVRLTWPGAEQHTNSSGPRAAAHLHLEPVQCHLRQRHLPLLSDAAAALAAAFAQRPQAPQPARWAFTC